MPHHIDENGELCTRHVPASPEAIFGLALLGSSVPRFHHDIASKLQSLIMTLEEIGELTARDDVRGLVTAAEETIRQLGTILSTNRSLTRPSRPERHSLTTLVGLASERSGVRVQAAMPSGDLKIGLWAATHALAMIFDLAAGPVHLGRTVDIAFIPESEAVVLEVTGPATALHPLPSNFSEVMALASFALTREGGQLRCGHDRLTIRLPWGP